MLLNLDKVIYNKAIFKKAAGLALRPGGLAITEIGLQLCAWPEKSLVADIGCGLGASLKLMKTSGLQAIGLDNCPESLRQAEMNSGCETILGQADKLPWPDEYLDGLVCECVLSLTADQSIVLNEFNRVLKSGGKLLLADISLLPFSNNSRFAVDSCLQGAAFPETTLHRLVAAGFTVKKINEYPEALKQLAAQLIWHGSTDLASWLGPYCPVDKRHGCYSYSQWIAEKSVYEK